MQVSRTPIGLGRPDSPPDLWPAMTALRAPTSAANVGGQLKAYQALASRWGEAGHAERAALTPALTGSPFAQRVQATLNAFTRAAWAGPDAAPPAPQVRMLAAFDQLDDADRQIVAAMQSGESGVPGLATPDSFRKRLQDAVERAQGGPSRDPAETITLSAAAQAQLAGAVQVAPDDPLPAPPDAAPEVARALAAYARTAG